MTAPPPRLVPDRPSDELKRCPFCNSPAEFVNGNDEDGRFAAVQCIRCGAGSCQHYYCGDDARDFAKAAWNRRAAAPPAEAPAERGEVETLREALADLLSWFPDAPVPAEWRLPAGTHGADDAITAAHDALGHKTCRFCGWRGIPETASDPYTTDGTVEVCGGCNNAESFA